MDKRYAFFRASAILFRVKWSSSVQMHWTLYSCLFRWYFIILSTITQFYNIVSYMLRGGWRELFRTFVQSYIQTVVLRVYCLLCIRQYSLKFISLLSIYIHVKIGSHFQWFLKSVRHPELQLEDCSCSFWCILKGLFSFEHEQFAVKNWRDIYFFGFPNNWPKLSFYRSSFTFTRIYSH